MLKTLEEMYATCSVAVNDDNQRIPLHSHTSKEQGIFLQEIFDFVKPQKSLEVGFAYGISALFILQKHRENNSPGNAHIVIEPDNYWGESAEYNIKVEKLSRWLQVERDYSHNVLPRLVYSKHRVQYAYIDTTKLFDVVLTDFYFIDKMLDIGGVIIFDDCGGQWTGIQRVARFVNSLSHYKVLAVHGREQPTWGRKLIYVCVGFLMKCIPFKSKLYPGISFKSDHEIGLNSSCIAFQKINEDTRAWHVDKPF